MSSTPSAPGTFVARLFPAGGAPLQVSSFMPPSDTPGNVAVCLSGGGSRALSAGMGALQAFEHVTLADGTSMLSRVKALSTVSGGSWLGVPFTFLDAATPDGNYLGTYTDPGNLSVLALMELPNGNAGANVTEHFSLVALAIKAWVLYEFDGVPANMLWQTLMALHLLVPYDLFEAGPNMAPTSFFSYDDETLGKIRDANAGTPLEAEKANVVAQVPGRQRPYLVCNTALFVTVQDPGTPENGTSALAPVQCTPFFTGIVGLPNAVDINQRLAGGGGVTSFAFASSLASVSGDEDHTVTVQQSRQWALADIVGTSSAAFAQTVHATLVDLATNPPRFAAALAMHGEDAVRLIARSGGDAPSARTFIASRVASARSGNVGILDSELADFQALIPRYQYWPVRGATPAPNIAPTDFADGGSLENSGIAAMLAYGDVDNLVAFIDTLTTLGQDSNGVIIVDDSIPPLFGYQPYDSTVKGGYAPYSTDTDQSSATWYYRFNQVFPSEGFAAVREGLWAASGGGSYRTAPIFSQPLTTVENAWFGVAPDKQVTVVWVYLEHAADWYDQLGFAEQLEVDAQTVLAGFPHYDTLNTELTPTQINLLANLVAWSVVNPNNVGTFTSLFAPAVTPPA
ncbi:MAG TPA: hypothetical protein VGU66_23305 [Candidatus Elarobacter sp.]|nr:hypothetical protein [Candidatus Elarobacter sp.]